MKSKSINDGVQRTFVLILDEGEEAYERAKDYVVGTICDGLRA